MVAEYMAVGEGVSCRKETRQLQITIHFLQNTFNKYLPCSCFGMSFVSAKYGLYSTFRDSPTIWCLCAFFLILLQSYVPFYVKKEKMCNSMCLSEFECAKRLKAHSQAIPVLYITLTSYWPRWHLKSPASRLFTQPFIETQIKENIKAPRHWTEAIYNEMQMLTFWWNSHHWLHWKLSKWQLPVLPMMKISSKWWHFHFSVCGVIPDILCEPKPLHYPEPCFHAPPHLLLVSLTKCQWQLAIKVVVYMPVIGLI